MVKFVVSHALNTPFDSVAKVLNVKQLSKAYVKP